MFSVLIAVAASPLEPSNIRPIPPAKAKEQAGSLLADDADEATVAGLFETTDSVWIEVTGPKSTLPSVGIDLNHNGKIDPETDFALGFAPDGSPCLTSLIAPGKSSTCRSPELKAEIKTRQIGHTVTTDFVLPKKAISSDQIGFGFDVRVWNSNGHYWVPLAAGEYKFGGTLRLSTDGSSFMGKVTQLSPQVLPAVHRYQGCLDRGVEALRPLDKTKLEQLKSVPSGCASVRSDAVKEAVQALVASGAARGESEQSMQKLLDEVDSGFRRLVGALEAGPAKP